MSLTNSVYKHIVVPLVERRRYAGLARNVAQFQSWERISYDEMISRQWREVSRLLAHAYNTTAFYRRRFESAGLHPSDIKSPEDLQSLPLLTRADIKANRGNLLSSAFNPATLVTSATGGTTDSPVPFEADIASIRHKLAIQSRYNEWAGLRSGDKIFYLWGARADYPENPSWRWRMYDRHLLRRVWAPPSLMNAEVFGKHHALLNDFRPKAVIAYPSALTLFSEYLERSGKTYHRPETVICTAESLLPDQRSVIERVLGCKIFEQYGSREFGMLGAECEAHSGLHLHPANALVEFLPVSDSDSTIREMIITDLLNFAMPLIRYKVNDCAEIDGDPCACGRPYPKLKRVLGRTTDILRFSNGDLVPGVILARRIAKACPKVRKWQLVQHSLDLCELRYVPAETVGAEDIGAMRANLSEVFPSRIEWQFTEVDEIPRERSGKTRMCISLVDPSTPIPNHVSSGAPS